MIKIIGDIMDLQKISKDILAQYPYRIELHAHSHPVSPCSEVTVSELVDIYHAAGFDALVLTNHFMASAGGCSDVSAFLDDYERACQYARQYSMKVYLGVEVRFAENNNDYLLYGVDRQILENVTAYFEKGLEAFVREGKDTRSVLIQAHPFRNHMELIDANLVDGFEVLNLHMVHNSRPATAMHHAVKCGANILIGGTDFHHADRQNPAIAMRVRTLPKDSFELAELIRSKDYCFESEGHIVLIP